ncbi:MAG TPA: alpha/beta hydrolase [Bacilli bacterium]
MSVLSKIYSFTIKYDTLFWRHSLYGIFAMAGVALIGISLGMPTGFGLWFDIPAFTLVCLLLLGLGIFLAAWILALARLPLPRMFISGVVCIYLTLSFSLSEFNLSYTGAAFITVVVMSLGFLIGSSIMVLRTQGSRSYITRFYVGVSLILLLGCLLWLFHPGEEVYTSAFRPFDTLEDQPQIDPAEDPSQPGGFAYHAFTYGSGSDPHRAEFGSGADYITASVDASSFLTDWRWPRKLFWGFDEQAIPLNGRVWMPMGQGPFPLVLIVHGSHVMEHFSDTGYDYLGEQLASRGFITVSVDENFINYSVWSGGVNWDMTVRAWILLQHVKAIGHANGLADSPFFGKADMEKVALIGHSRGGQAAALAAEFDQFYNQTAHKEISLEVDFPIKAIVAISPTDKVLEDKRIYLHNVNYLLLQGSQDSDVNTYSGAQQYRRTTFTGNDYYVKASLYIDGANHGQFNTVWGNSDTSLPTALLLNKKEIIHSADQRHIAKTYISAFLEAVLHGKKNYLPMFRDYRTALDWLPKTGYISQFEDSLFLKISDFEEDRIAGTTGISGGSWAVEGLEKREEQEIKDRQGRLTGNHAVYIGWDGQSEGSYSLGLPTGFARSKGMGEDSKLVFSLANMDTGMDKEDRKGNGSDPQISIEMITEDGIAVKHPLSRFRSIPPVIHSRFMKLDFFEENFKGGKLGNSSEPVFQTFEIPLADFVTEHSGFEPSKLQQIRFVFEPGLPGKILMDNIGFALRDF